MKFSSLNRSKRQRDPARQAEREARKAANRQHFAPGEATLLFVDKDGREVFELRAAQIPGYTYAF